MTDFDAERHTAGEFAEMQNVSTSDWLMELHEAVWLFLKEPKSEERLDKLAGVHANVTRYLLRCGFRVDERQGKN